MDQQIRFCTAPDGVRLQALLAGKRSCSPTAASSPLKGFDDALRLFKVRWRE
jgi:hypothetical protein